MTSKYTYIDQELKIDVYAENKKGKMLSSV